MSATPSFGSFFTLLSPEARSAFPRVSQDAGGGFFANDISNFTADPNTFITGLEGFAGNVFNPSSFGSDVFDITGQTLGNIDQTGTFIPIVQPGGDGNQLPAPGSGGASDNPFFGAFSSSFGQSADDFGIFDFDQSGGTIDFADFISFMDRIGQGQNPFVAFNPNTGGGGGGDLPPGGGGLTADDIFNDPRFVSARAIRDNIFSDPRFTASTNTGASVDDIFSDPRFGGRLTADDIFSDPRFPGSPTPGLTIDDLLSDPRFTGLFGGGLTSDDIFGDPRFPGDPAPGLTVDDLLSDPRFTGLFGGGLTADDIFGDPRFPGDPAPGLTADDIFGDPRFPFAGRLTANNIFDDPRFGELLAPGLTVDDIFDDPRFAGRLTADNIFDDPRFPDSPVPGLTIGDLEGFFTGDRFPGLIGGGDGTSFSFDFGFDPTQGPGGLPGGGPGSVLDEAAILDLINTQIGDFSGGLDARFDALGTGIDGFTANLQKIIDDIIASNSTDSGFADPPVVDPDDPDTQPDTSVFGDLGLPGLVDSRGVLSNSLLDQIFGITGSQDLIGDQLINRLGAGNPFSALSSTITDDDGNQVLDPDSVLGKVFGNIDRQAQKGRDNLLNQFAVTNKLDQPVFKQQLGEFEGNVLDTKGNAAIGFGLQEAAADEGIFRGRISDLLGFNQGITNNLGNALGQFQNNFIQDLGLQDNAVNTALQNFFDTLSFNNAVGSAGTGFTDQGLSLALSFLGQQGGTSAGTSAANIFGNLVGQTKKPPADNSLLVSLLSNPNLFANKKEG